MRLGTKSFLIVMASTLGLVLGLHAFARGFIVKSFAAHEVDLARERGRHVRALLAFEARELGDSAEDWAQWNDLIIYAAERNEAWETENLTPLSYKMKSWTDLAIVRDDRSRAWAKMLRPDESFGPIHGELDRLVDEGNLSFPRGSERPVQGLALLDSEVYLVASSPLQNPTGPTRQHGSLIATQRLDSAWVARFSRRSSIDLRFTDAGEPADESDRARALAASDGMALVEHSDSDLDIFVRVDDFSGDAPIVVAIREPRPLVGAARSVLAVVTILLSIGGVVAAALCLLLLHVGVVRRIRRLATASEQLGRGDLILLDTTGEDELGTFADDFAMMGRVVLEREQSTREATSKRKLVLDHAGDALVTCDGSGRVVGEVSAAASEWFGRPAPGALVWDYVAGRDDSLRVRLRSDFAAATGQPRERGRVVVGERVLDASWSIVRAGMAGSIVLLVLHDMTALVQQRMREEEECQEQKRWQERVRSTQSERGDRRLSAVEHGELLCQLLASGASDRAIAAVEAWRGAPVEAILNGLVDAANRIAAKLDKAVLVEVSAIDLRVDRQRTAAVWTNLVHLVRNAVDHGLESAPERLARGKPAIGHLRLSAQADAGNLTVTVQDDGRGIDWAAVRLKAHASGLPCATQEELEEATFSDAFSTRTEATEISGRGVGLAAIRAAARSLGGDVVIRSVAGAGTSFQVTFPCPTAEPLGVGRGSEARAKALAF